MANDAPFSSILVAYDGTDHAQAGLALAHAVAGPATRVTIVNVVDPTPILVGSAAAVTACDVTPLLDALDDEAHAIVTDARARWNDAGSLVTEVVHDQPVPGIVAAAEECGADLIVMGTHARTGLSRTFLGSTAEGVLRACAVPVIVTHAGAANGARAFARILVAVDDSGPADAALALAARLRAAGSRLIVAHVSDTAQLYDNATTYGFDPASVARDIERESASIVSRALEGAGLATADVEVALLEGAAATTIVEEARTRDVGTIVIGSHGRRGISRFFLGSVAEHVVRAADRPVLVVRSE
jgi:nucleotide-binding universal stress UspA family protein